MALKVKVAVLSSLAPHRARLYAELAATAPRFIECHRLSPTLHSLPQTALHPFPVTQPKKRSSGSCFFNFRFPEKTMRSLALDSFAH